MTTNLTRQITGGLPAETISAGTLCELTGKNLTVIDREELELMEKVVARAKAAADRPTSVELRQQLLWALQSLDAFHAKRRH